jgi:DNA-binding IclR family transcriptional regulator
MPSKKDRAPIKTEYSFLVPAVEQASRILLALAQGGTKKMTLTEICSAVGIHKSKGYSILNTLQHFAFIQRSPYGKTYSLGPGLLFLSSKIMDSLDLREAIVPVLRQLSLETKSTAFLGLISDDHVFVVAKDEGTQDIGVTIRLGHRFPITWGAHGKSIAAFLPDDERRNILRSPKLHYYGDPSKFDPVRFERDMADCRRDGFATDFGDMVSGVRAAAAPVFGPGGKLIGSLAVVGTFHADAVERYGSEVAKAAKRFSGWLAGTPQGAFL